MQIIKAGIKSGNNKLLTILDQIIFFILNLIGINVFNVLILTPTIEILPKISGVCSSD